MSIQQKSTKKQSKPKTPKFASHSINLGDGVERVFFLSVFAVNQITAKYGKDVFSDSEWDMEKMSVVVYAAMVDQSITYEQMCKTLSMDRLAEVFGQIFATSE